MITYEFRNIPSGALYTGHWINVVNQKGIIRFLDGQSGYELKDWAVMQDIALDPEKDEILDWYGGT